MAKDLKHVAVVVVVVFLTSDKPGYLCFEKSLTEWKTVEFGTIHNFKYGKRTMVL